MKFRNLYATEIECRISQIKSSWATLLLYKDARCDMNILDETVGPLNWQRKHTRENANCIVSIYNKDINQWIEKEDTGAESYTEKEKGLASDSFKRACFNWGIGRELYTAPFVKIKTKSEKEFFEHNGKFKTWSKFKVSDIEYEGKVISYLEITDQDGQVRFTHGMPSLLTDDELAKIEALNMDEKKEKQWKNYFKVDTFEHITSKQAKFLLEKMSVKHE